MGEIFSPISKNSAEKMAEYICTQKLLPKIKDSLEKVIKILNDTSFGGWQLIFQHDFAAIRKAKTTQRCLQTNLSLVKIVRQEVRP